MTDAHKTTTLARPPKAFEIDASWYQSYWYDRPQSELRKPSFRSVQVSCVGALCSSREHTSRFESMPA